MNVKRVLVSVATAAALVMGGAQVAGAQPAGQAAGAQVAGQETAKDEDGSAARLSSLSSESSSSTGTTGETGDADKGDKDDEDSEVAAMSSEVVADLFGPLAPLVLALSPLLAKLLGFLDVITDAVGSVANLGAAVQ
ncbi:hypothetical protein [Corynebacterium cystitidis]|uniref:hypothetical protein n=1 Tax=Corynebacterium cystitidis TaxID=35757 RepID=UPI00211DE57A|nr:hypothetical protein [Corynebacterium cystitidis]